jgi:hypothetical protein
VIRRVSTTCAMIATLMLSSCGSPGESFLPDYPRIDILV